MTKAVEGALSDPDVQIVSLEDPKTGDVSAVCVGFGERAKEDTVEARGLEIGASTAASWCSRHPEGCTVLHCRLHGDQPTTRVVRVVVVAASATATATTQTRLLVETRRAASGPLPERNKRDTPATAPPKSSQNSERKDAKSDASSTRKEVRLKRVKSRELYAGVVYTDCDCYHRNGLQHDCPRTPCGGTRCNAKPQPECDLGTHFTTKWENYEEKLDRIPPTAFCGSDEEWLELIRTRKKPAGSAKISNR